MHKRQALFLIISFAVVALTGVLLYESLFSLDHNQSFSAQLIDAGIEPNF